MAQPDVARAMEPTGPPDRLRAIESYRRRAAGYDASAQRTMRLRARTIGKLGLAPGDCVLDAGAGTGLSFAALAHAVGGAGRVIAIELSPDMARLAEARIAREGYRTVSLHRGAAEDVALPHGLDAVLFNFTHDILQSPAALRNIFASAREGARIAVAGSRLYPRWLAPLNAYVRWNNAPYLTTFSGLDRPWRHLAAYVPDLRIEAALCGAGYVASGVHRKDACAR